MFRTILGDDRGVGREEERVSDQRNCQEWVWCRLAVQYICFSHQGGGKVNDGCCTVWCRGPRMGWMTNGWASGAMAELRGRRRRRIAYGKTDDDALASRLSWEGDTSGYGPAHLGGHRV
nr:hypothetical protein CFP56_21617 [Quercus suber]